ncbi:MAG TPA: PaaI family thioesterase [Blastocatellia bacterium]|nr:PaaI family thioesterase [Blastocatellia bacterium]HMV87779.1 PaaI family thioesterase [Blastocatellia bacterium]HMX29350.1 PaaI family thioesterase [Blastocatellia bacterium]HMY75731.1 PaaI family thioesterase [Blastocatellia bacterium]HNG30920.1 PaaI family thioesterase [Blastocatellia bacterium]
MIESEDARLQSHVRKSPFAEVLGLEPIEAKPGHVLLRLPFSENLLQSLGRVHGGALFSLADHASGWAAYSMLEKNERCATLEMKINYIAALHDEDCIAEACVIHKGRTSIVVEAELKTSQGRLLAKTLATFIVLKNAE